MTFKQRLPFFLGGDKLQMGTNFQMEIKTDPNDMFSLVEAAQAFYSRNWSVDKKLSI